MPSRHIPVTREEAEAVIALAGQGSTVSDLAEVLSTSEEHVIELLERVRAGQVQASPAVQAPVKSSRRTGFLVAGIALVCFALGALYQSLRPGILGAAAPAPMETAKTEAAFPIPTGTAPEIASAADVGTARAASR